MKVLVTEPIHEKGMEILHALCETAGPTGADPASIKAAIADCDAVLIRSAVISADIMDAAPGLKCIAKHGIGVDNIDVEAATARGIRVVNAPTSNLNAVAEQTLTLILSVLKDVAFLDRGIRAGQYATLRKGLSLGELTGKTVGLVGIGRIARRVVELLGPFQTRILVYDPFADPAVAASCGAIAMPDLGSLLEQADIVSIHVPLSDETRNMIGKAELACMKPGAILVNAARGGIVDEAALVAALDSGALAGAGTDVFVQEPPLADSPLLRSEKLTMSPHSAALTAEALEAMATQAATGIVEVLRGQEPTFPVNRV